MSGVKNRTRTKTKMRNRLARLRSFRRNKDALSSLITVAGIMATIVMVIGLVLNILVPQWAKEDESEHMEKVLRNYVHLRKNIENLIDNSDFDITTTQTIKLGASGNIPVGAIPSSGKLTLNPLSNTTEEIITSMNDAMVIYGKGGGNLEYESTNYYYEDQVITYEHGAVVLGQAGGSVMKAEPDFEIEKYPLLNDTDTYGWFDPGTKDEPGEVPFRFAGRNGNVTLTYDVYDVDVSGEVLIRLNGYVVARAPLTGNEKWTGPHKLDLRGDMVNDLTTNRLEFNHTNIGGSDSEWGVRNITLSGNETRIRMTMVSLIGSREDVGGRDSHTVVAKLLAEELNSYSWPSENLTFNFETKSPEAWRDYFNTKLNETSTNLRWSSNIYESDFHINVREENEDLYVVSVTIKEVNHLDCTLANIRMDIS